MKRFLTVLIVALMLVSIVPVPASASNYLDVYISYNTACSELKEKGFWDTEKDLAIYVIEEKLIERYGEGTGKDLHSLMALHNTAAKRLGKPVGVYRFSDLPEIPVPENTERQEEAAAGGNTSDPSEYPLPDPKIQTQENKYSEYDIRILATILSTLITAAAYSMFPLLLSIIRKKPITAKRYRMFCYLLNLLVMIVFIAVNGSSSGVPYILWTSVFCHFGKKTLEQRNLISNKCESER